MLDTLRPALPCYFISDLHLQASRPDLKRGFEYFLNNIANDAQTIFILGDFFDVWIGDDHSNAFIRHIKQLLKTKAKTGVQLYFVHGNRDFLIGKEFADEAGIELLPEKTLVELSDSKTLLLHGDELCLDDHAYQAFRAKVRNPKWQAETLAKPLWLRKLYAAYLRFRSKRANRGKQEMIMDVSPDAVKETFASFGVRHMIHGHTHRPKTHELELDGQVCERVVLGDWETYGWYYRVDDTHASLARFVIP